MPKHTALDPAVLEAALVGLEHQKSEIDAKAAAIHRMLRADSTSNTATAPGTQKKRRLNAAARKRIADATRKRWAAYRSKKTAKVTRKKTAA